MQQQQAIARLNGDGFDVSGIVGPASEPRGIVVSQNPGGGSRLDKGQTVAIRVSNGQPVGAVTQAAETTTAPPTTSGATTAQVPDVTGQDAASGAGRVEAAGFVAQTDPVDATGTAGTIAQQLPAAGAQAGVGGVVVVSVGCGASRPAGAVAARGR